MSGRPDPWHERARRDAVLAGDAAAWASWVHELFEPVAAYVRWRCAGDADLADDVLQDTWLTAARRLAAFEPDCGSFAAWVSGIAANVVRNQLRGRRRTRARLQPLPGDVAEPDRRETAIQVACALAELPERYEAVLRAKYLDGLTVIEIASARGETEKAIESLLTRARQAFRDAYDCDREDSP